MVLPLKRLRGALFLGVLALVAESSFAEGYVTKQATPFFDAPSLVTEAKGILSIGYPVRQLVRVSGWRKVKTYTNEEGWIVENDLERRQSGVVLVDHAKVYVEPSEEAAVIFYAQRGVILEVLQQEDQRGWIQVVHRDGEVGHILAKQLWKNE